MSKCPHCDKTLEIDDVVQRNIESYHETVLTHTVCCNKPVQVYGRMVYFADKYTGSKKVDDWGNPITQPVGTNI